MFHLPALRNPWQRDVLARFVTLSLAMHLTFAAPWDVLLGWLGRALGFHGVAITQKEVDAPTVIDIDVDGIADKPVELAGDPASANGNGGSGGGAYVGDAALPNDAATEAGPAGVSDGGPDTPPEGGADSGRGPVERVRDPNALSGGLASLAPKNKEVNVSMLIRTDHIRQHPIGKQLGAYMAKVPQWAPFFRGTGLDPVAEFDAILAMGPRFYETSRLTAIIVHHRTDAEMLLTLRAVAAGVPGSEWIGDDDVPAFRGKIDNAVRVVVMLPSGLIVTPTDGETQALAIGRKLVASKKTAKDVVPRSDPDLAVAWFLRKPSNVLNGIPTDLDDAHVNIRLAKDHGLILDMDARTPNAAAAETDAKTVHDLVERSLPTGFARMVARPYVEGYSVTAEDTVVHVHHALSGEKVDSLWDLVKTVL